MVQLYRWARSPEDGLVFCSPIQFFSGPQKLVLFPRGPIPLSLASRRLSDFCPGCLGAKSIYLDFLMFESFITFVT